MKIMGEPAKSPTRPRAHRPEPPTARESLASRRPFLPPLHSRLEPRNLSKAKARTKAQPNNRKASELLLGLNTILLPVSFGCPNRDHDWKLHLQEEESINVDSARKATGEGLWVPLEAETIAKTRLWSVQKVEKVLDTLATARLNCWLHQIYERFPDRLRSIP